MVSVSDYFALADLAGHGNDRAGAGQAESLVDLPSLSGTHSHGAHARQIQKDSAVGGGIPGGMAPSAFHRDLEVV